MSSAYAVRFPIPPSLWMTTVDGETIPARARRRARLRRLGRHVWRDARRHGAHPVGRFLMLATIAGRPDSPMLAAETLKPLIDAGTDEGLWPDDDPTHRTLTCYLKDPRPTRDTLVHIWIIPVSPGENPVMRLITRPQGVQGFPIRTTIPEHLWLTSNMRLDPAERRRRLDGIIRLGVRSWAGRSIGARAAMVTLVRYPDHRSEYKGDPDNTAETATALWGAGALHGLAPATPTLAGFALADGESMPGTHDMDMFAFTTPMDVDWPTLLLT